MLKAVESRRGEVLFVPIVQQLPDTLDACSRFLDLANTKIMGNDIELNIIESHTDIPQNPDFPRQNGIKNMEYGPSHNEESDEDEEDQLIMEDGSRALLSSSRSPRSSIDRPKESMVPAKTWPQIQSIVIEVNAQ
jgi:hypothetical protein